MTGCDLIVLVPWIVFGAALAAVYGRLLRSRHLSRRRPECLSAPPPGQAGCGGAGGAPQREGQPPGCDQHGDAAQ